MAELDSLGARFGFLRKRAISQVGPYGGKNFLNFFHPTVRTGKFQNLERKTHLHFFHFSKSGVPHLHFFHIWKCGKSEISELKIVDFACFHNFYATKLNNGSQ